VARAHDARQVSPAGVRLGAPYGSTAKPTPEELKILNNSELGKYVARRTNTGRGATYGMTSEEAVLAAGLMDRSQVVSPLAGLPVSGSYGDFSYAKTVLDGDWDEYWQDSQVGYGYKNLSTASVTSGKDREPAPISVVPTSSTNPERPRTVAAGYDVSRNVLTVVFRDGTFYNYYNVDPGTWRAFKDAHSKGQFIARYLDYTDRGTANMKKTSIAAREQLYRVARTGQISHGATVANQFDRAAGFPHHRVPRVSPVAAVKKVPGI